MVKEIVEFDQKWVTSNLKFTVETTSAMLGAFVHNGLTTAHCALSKLIELWI